MRWPWSKRKPPDPLYLDPMYQAVLDLEYQRAVEEAWSAAPHLGTREDPHSESASIISAVNTLSAHLEDILSELQEISEKLGDLSSTSRNLASVQLNFFSKADTLLTLSPTTEPEQGETLPSIKPFDETP